jgi:ribosomal protein S18 acetylase RimI-like enzyme
MGCSNQPRRVATADEAATAVELLVGAFYADPTWSWAFPDPQRRAGQQRALWTLFVRGALRYPWVWLDAGSAATSVWIPPGGTELAPDQEAELERLLVDQLGADAGRVLAAVEQFGEAHPRDEPHYYLSLLGTDPARRGHGHGLALLAANLELIDAERTPAYLEASNPANVPLYERYGFERIGSFELAGGPVVHTMWRAARAGAGS